MKMGWFSIVHHRDIEKFPLLAGEG